MDIFNEELINYWKSLNHFGVKYIMVGGVATNFNGYQRTTDDIDVRIKDTKENRRKYRAAFKEYSGIDYSMMERMQIVPGWTSFNLNNDYKVDLLINMKGLEMYSFDECHDLASLADIDGLLIPFLHINHLIANKKLSTPLKIS